MDAHLITNLFNHTLEPSPEVRAQAEKQLTQVSNNVCLCVLGATPQAKVTQDKYSSYLATVTDCFQKKNQMDFLVFFTDVIFNFS